MCIRDRERAGHQSGTTGVHRPSSSSLPPSSSPSSTLFPPSSSSPNKPAGSYTRYSSRSQTPLAPYALSGTDLARGACQATNVQLSLNCTPLAASLPPGVNTVGAMMHTDATPKIREKIAQYNNGALRLAGTSYAMVLCRVRAAVLSYAVSGTEIGYGATSPAIGLRARYAMPGTDVASGAISLRACYAMSGTDGAYGAMPALDLTSSNAVSLDLLSTLQAISAICLRVR
eukprot:2342101-Rhodomonas_salina.1